MQKFNKIGSIVICLLMVLCIFVCTCPDRRAHIEAFTEECITAYDNSPSMQATRGLSDAEKPVIFHEIWDEYMHYNNYIVFSVGKVYDEGQFHVASIGILGHIFMIIDHQDIEDFWNQ